MWPRRKAKSSAGVKLVPSQAEVLDQAEKERQTAKLIEWRKIFDQDRVKALAEGRGCGSCIEGVVFWGSSAEDQGACFCEIAKAKQAKLEEESV